MRIIFTLLLLSSFLTIHTQTTADFENLLSQSESFFNGSDASGGFESGNVWLQNIYVDDPDYPYWAGWSVSNITDTTTAGYENQYSCIVGSGVNDSETYAVAYAATTSLLNTTGMAEGGTLEGCYITNSTYTYLSMRDGDPFTSKFGGEDGTDPDYLYVTIKEYGNRAVTQDSINIYLADYRSDDPAQDYLLDEWLFVDLTVFENVDTLSFTMYSSDVGAFGINTPTYFCLDNLITTDMALTNVAEISFADLPNVYPNPTEGLIRFPITATEYELRDLEGRLIKFVTNSPRDTMTLEELDSGIYLLRWKDTNSNEYLNKIVRI